VHATPAGLRGSPLYGLNVTNSRLAHNAGSGLVAVAIRDRMIVNNASIHDNQGHAGILIVSGAADVWINNTQLVANWGDGLNATMVGGSVLLNGTLLRGNRMRGAHGSILLNS
jgi:hypothetical protein